MNELKQFDYPCRAEDVYVQCCMQMHMHMDLATQAYTRSVCDLGMDSGINLDISVKRQPYAYLICFILDLYRVCNVS